MNDRNVWESKKKDARALFIIQQAMDEPIFPRIMAATTSKEAWDLLQEEYQGTSKVISVKLQTLRRDFENLIMKNSESIQVFFSRVTSIVNQIRTYGGKLDDQKFVEKVLRSLPNKFDHVVAAIEESKDLSTYSMNELMVSLQAHEQRLNKTTENPLEQAFQSNVASKKRFDDSDKGFQGGRGRGCGRFRSRGRDQIMLIKIAGIRIVEIRIEIYHNIFIAKDSGCSNHMIRNKDYFLEIDETIKPRVRMSDNNHVNAHGINPIVVSTLNFYHESGIKRQLTASYTPQQNGVVEWKNRTFVEAARSMLKDKGLPNDYWAEAVATAVYLCNRAPTKVVQGKTPYEGWSGRKPNVSNFKNFGSIAYAFVPSEKR
ncbi:uncharacterized protein LOC143861537 [Tasmannia lanceolata]|uniref:uncharacterized protein LOC143861537 n=1 Tax=Tasmannia lanceolata TaxID=3420 RepID=UPI004062D9C0